jgi:hypothetical protein
MDTYDASEQDVVTQTFATMLWAATRDGGKKRAAGIKPPWYEDGAHEAAIFSHLDKWKHGETRDKDSGSHPLVHLAWRALAIAYQETYGTRDPAKTSIPELQPRLISKIDGADTFADTEAGEELRKRLSVKGIGW